MEKEEVSVIIPSKGAQYLEYTLKSISNQTVKPTEVILILKDCDVERIKKMCEKYRLKYIIEEQKKGYFTHALNIGKKLASGDILMFTDDDVIIPNRWIENYVKTFLKYPQEIGGISSRVMLYDLAKNTPVNAPDDKLHIRLYRSLIRSILDKPIPILSKYKLGSYISTRYKFVYGRGIPNAICYSLPFRGVNMAFRSEAVSDIWFIEHKNLKRGFRNEQHFGIQLILKGYDSIYIPNNPVYHILRESLSRGKDRKIRKQLKKEEEIVKNEIMKLLNYYKGSYKS